MPLSYFLVIVLRSGRYTIHETGWAEIQVEVMSPSMAKMRPTESNQYPVLPATSSQIHTKAIIRDITIFATMFYWNSSLKKEIAEYALRHCHLDIFEDTLLLCVEEVDDGLNIALQVKLGVMPCDVDLMWLRRLKFV